MTLKWLGNAFAYKSLKLLELTHIKYPSFRSYEGYDKNKKYNFFILNTLKDFRAMQSP